MKKTDVKKVHELTGDYSKLLQATLQDKEVACAHLQVALDAYQDKAALLLTVEDVADAQGGLGWLAKETHLNRKHLYYTHL